MARYTTYIVSEKFGTLIDISDAKVIQIDNNAEVPPATSSKQYIIDECHKRGMNFYLYVAMIADVYKEIE